MTTPAFPTSEVDVSKMEYDDSLLRWQRARDEERRKEMRADAKARDDAAATRERAAADLNERGMKLQEAIRADAITRDKTAATTQKTMTCATVAYVVLTAAIFAAAGVQAWAAWKQASAPPPVFNNTVLLAPANSK